MPLQAFSALLFFFCVFTPLIALGTSAQQDPTMPTLSEEAIAIQKRANNMFAQSDWSQAQRFFDDATQVLETADDFSAMSIYASISYVYLSIDDFNQAKTFALKGLSLMTDQYPVPERARLLFYLGQIQGRQGLLAESLDTFQSIILLYKEHNLAPEDNHISALAAIHSLLGNYEKSISYFKQLIPRVADSPVATMRLKANLGALYVYTEDYDTALTLLLEAKAMRKTLGVNYETLDQNLGYVYLLIEDYPNAITTLNVALESNRKNNQHTQMAMAHKSLGEAYLRQGNIDTALSHLNKAYDLFEGDGFIQQNLELYPVLIEAEEAAGNYTSALTYFREYKALHDKFNSLESQKHAESLQANYELKIEQERVKQLELEQALQQKSLTHLEEVNKNTNTLNKLMQGLSVSLLIMLIAGVFVLRYRYKLNAKLIQQNTEIDELNKQLHKLSFSDALTTLKNRNYLARYISDFLNQAKQTTPGECTRLLLMILDIDHFKALNDTYGHGEGDKALAYFASQLKKIARKSDVVARWGGEEFVWLLKNTDIEEVTVLFARWQSQLKASPFTINGKDIELTCSAGVCEIVLEESLTDAWLTALKIADMALYKAKDAGRNTWRGYQLITPIFKDGDIDFAATQNHNGLRMIGP